jgi:thiosulfate/3-mercaptopyruvate sulfurtransferase
MTSLSSSFFENDLVQAEQLLADGSSDRLYIDVRLGDPPEELDKFRKSHIFGSVHAQIRDVFAAEPNQTTGNLPLPSMERLMRHLNEWQVSENTELIMYGPSPALAARGWWTLKWAGLKRVRLLDGGLRAWTAAGGAVAKGDPPARSPRRSQPPRLSLGHMPNIEVDEVERLSSDARLIDARDENAYLAGHIPKAMNLAANEFWTPSGRLRTRGEIAEIYRNAKVSKGQDVVVYCGGGVLSAMHILTMSAIGNNPRLFVGSWSEWMKAPRRMAASAQEGGAHG